MTIDLWDTCTCIGFQWLTVLKSTFKVERNPNNVKNLFFLHTSAQNHLPVTKYVVDVNWIKKIWWSSSRRWHGTLSDIFGCHFGFGSASLPLVKNRPPHEGQKYERIRLIIIMKLAVLEVKKSTITMNMTSLKRKWWMLKTLLFQTFLSFFSIFFSPFSIYACKCMCVGVCIYVYVISDYRSENII